MQLNIELSRKAAERVEPDKKGCYRNALLALLVLEDLAEGMYVEGTAVDEKIPFLPIEHGWIELEGEIVDPTLVSLGSEVVEYFPARKWTREEAEDLVGIELPVGNLRHRPYQEAYALAIKFIEEGS